MILGTFLYYICTWSYKIKGTGMTLNLLAEPTPNSKSLNNVLFSPGYCNLEPVLIRISASLGNLSAKEIVIPPKAVIAQVQMVNMIPRLYAPEGQISTGSTQEESIRQVGLGHWTEEQQ